MNAGGFDSEGLLQLTLLHKSTYQSSVPEFFLYE